ncbi:MAG TPA: glycosyltransferase family 87 protein [Opitutaceae bacterium]|nr:glycosyltransferase family 87 protein [Opitutaceae bacterium]
MPKTARENFGRQAPASFQPGHARSGGDAGGMNEPAKPAGRLRAWLRSPVRLALAASGVVFVWAALQFYEPGTGFSSLVGIGDSTDARAVTALKRVPHYVYEHSAGYDGAYYAQIAMHPTLDNPELTQAIDNLPYRARRMLFCWTAWLLGAGQPAWILQAHALLNVICWFVLGAVLLRWFPPVDWDRFFRWFAVMFSHGVCMSVRNSLVDGPSLLVVAIALRWFEEGRRGRAGVALALAGLGKETSLLATAGFAEGAAWRTPRAWLHFAGHALLVALPLLAWMGYIRLKFGPGEDQGLGNFTLPLAGLAEKWGEAVAGFGLPGTDPRAQWAMLLAVAAITLQGLFFLLRWRVGDPWWRVGAAFAVMMIFLSTPVWEGYPGAFTRVLLPMTLAFNVTVPRGRRWLPLLLAGNLSICASGLEFSPPREFFRLSGDGATIAALQVRPLDWYGSENLDGKRWRWSGGHSALRIRNNSERTLVAAFRGHAAATDGDRHLGITVGGVAVWFSALQVHSTEFHFECSLPPGETVVHFTSEKPARPVGDDARPLAFNIANLEVVVRAPSSPP